MAFVPVDPFTDRGFHYAREVPQRFMLRVCEADGEPRIFDGKALAWPTAQPVLPYVKPVRLEDVAGSTEILPLVQFDDASLVSAIKMLATQGRLNLIFDPRVLEREYPPVSIRLDHVSAVSVFQALLSKNGLRVEIDPRTTIVRVTF